MSLKSGLAALNLEFTDTVPRTEYSAESHWPLLKAVTGIDTDIIENRREASRRFIKAWDYAFDWSTYVNRKFFQRNKGRFTDMGHAVYAELADGSGDRRESIACPFSDPEEVFTFDPIEEYGIFPRSALIAEFEAKYDELCRENEDTVNTGGVYITMFSGLIDIFGWDMLLTSLGLDPDRFGHMVDRYYGWVRQFYEAYADSRIPVIMSHDDLCWTSGPVVNPAWYRRYIFPSMKKLWAPLKEAGKKIMFTSDGDWTAFFGDIIECGADTVVMEPMSDMALFAERYGKTHGFVGNADTRVLLSGTKEEIRAEVKRCMDIGKPYPGFIFCTGNHIPQNTPVESALIYQEAYLEMRKR